MARRFFLAPLLVALAACAPTAHPAVGYAGQQPLMIDVGPVMPRDMSARDAILAAADAAPRAVPGRFIVPIRAYGIDRGRLYLNSEADYRDQRNVSVAVSPQAMVQLERIHRAGPGPTLVGRTLLVQGAARRVRIDFTENGQPTGKYYYQTHIDVQDAAQITVVPTSANDRAG